MKLTKRVRRVLRRRPSPATALLTGAAAGLAGSAAMMAASRAGTKVVLPRGEKLPSAGARVVKAVGRAHEHEVPRPVAAAVGAGLELGFGVGMGAVYGLARSAVRPPAWLGGALLGAAAWAISSSKRGMMPRFGAAPPPTLQPLDKVSIPVIGSLALGFGTAFAFAALQKRGL